MAHANDKKLTREIVEQIRSETRCSHGGKKNGITIREMAEKYNTSYRNIRAILDNESWHSDAL